MTSILGEWPAVWIWMLVKSEDEAESSQMRGCAGCQACQSPYQSGVSEGASDIHIEPVEKYLRLRYRIDGELKEKIPSRCSFGLQIISRLKIMAGMDIAEKRKPQDGRFR